MIESLEAFARTLVIAPHPDDEVLGAGGTIARLSAAGGEVTVAIVTKAVPPAYSEEYFARTQSEAGRANELLGVKKVLWLNQPAAQLAEVPHRTLNEALRQVVIDLAPTALLLPFVGDIHLDHQLAALSALVAARPHQSEYPRTILAYETVSETHWNAPYVTPSFVPNVFIDIEATLPRKLEAMQAYKSQLRDFPHQRSLDSLRALAVTRGTAVHCSAAEAFVLIRQVL